MSRGGHQGQQRFPRSLQDENYRIREEQLRLEKELKAVKLSMVQPVGGNGEATKHQWMIHIQCGG